MDTHLPPSDPSGPKSSPTDTVQPLPGLRLWAVLLKALTAMSPDLASRVAVFLFTIPGRKARHARQDHLLYSARRAVVRSGKYRIRTYQWGDGPRRILLLHGWQSRGTALRYLAPVFTARGYTVVAMDAPGHGESSGWRTTMVTYARAIRDVDLACGPFTAAVTHSFGGRGLSYALAFEDHDWSIDRIVMLAAPSAFEEIIDTFMHRLGMPDRLRPAILGRMEQLLGRPVGETEIFSLGDRLHARILLVHDEQDQVVPVWEAERIAARLPGIRLMRTRGFGHYRMAKSPEIWEAALDFITRARI